MDRRTFINSLLATTVATQVPFHLAVSRANAARPDALFKLRLGGCAPYKMEICEAANGWVKHVGRFRVPLNSNLEREYEPLIEEGEALQIYGAQIKRNGDMMFGDYTFTVYGKKSTGNVPGPLVEKYRTNYRLYSDAAA